MAQRKVDNKALMVTKRSTIDCGKGKTEQSQAKFCDINYILKNYQKTGNIEHAKQFAGQYDDISVQDFTDAMNMVTEASEMYQDLPSAIRKQTGSPAGFLEFVQNPANAEKLKELGLLAGNDGLKADGSSSNAPTAEPNPQATEPAPAQPNPQATEPAPAQA